MLVSELTASAAARGTNPTTGAVLDHEPPILHTPMRNRASSSKSNVSGFVRSGVNSLVKWQLLDSDSIERARQENKLLFLHIGYKACHYCRLMARESFQNAECAAVLNESFVPVLVDREERPDIDAIYMNYLQAVSHAGGWPLNVFVTPNMEPVFGGTYWPGPSTSRRLVAGTGAEAENETLDSLTVFKKIRDIWRDQEAKCRKEASEILGQLRDFAAEGTVETRGMAASSHPNATHGTSSPSPVRAASDDVAVECPTGQTSAPLSSELDLDQLEEAYAHIAKTFDPVHGGFGLAPKFLTPSKLAFLLYLDKAPPAVRDVVGQADCKHAAHMAVETLRRIRDGALHDHVGLTGFARCSVTRDWSVPNFEKLVVDNAMLLALYLDAWRSAGGKAESDFLDTVVELADYLTSPCIALSHGGLACSEAADSIVRRDGTEKKEGAYYLWTRREFDSVINASDQDKQISQVAAAHWDVREDGNVDEEHDPNDDFIKQNILRVVRTPDKLSAQFGLPVQTVQQHIQTARERLKARRDSERIRPELDDKVIAAWNGLGISALAQTSTALREIDPVRSQKYLSGARNVVDFVRAHLWDKSSKILYRVWPDGHDVEGFADDYAYMIDGLLRLFDATEDESLLEFADDLQKTQITLFHDPDAGGFFSTPSTLQNPIIRLKEGMDSSLPSINAVAAANLCRLAALLDDDTYAALATGTVNAFEAEMLQYPWLYPGMLLVVAKTRLGDIQDPVPRHLTYKARRDKAAV
ncbi:hypothetical protein E4U42_000505 [Claviceps africana]|uniref:Spermatogenesis-associated protein 20-like TRX domain-containing protein n=1 Tax=Claviceps africana TaxID=83212 RepID=A0A8K0J9Y8_9HYPO|nr:hypothetical protein E4U42_000505 [Claviceps africana]